MLAIETKTANEAWREASNAFLCNLTAKDQPSRAGDTKELLRTTFHIQNPLQRWIISRTPAINPAFSIVETIWVLSGLNNSSFLKFWNRQLPKYAGKCNSYHGAYGYRLRKNFNFDQIEQAYFALKSNPETRQVVLQIWDAQKDLPHKTGSPRSMDVPCNLLSILKIRENKLEWTQIVRSNDLFLGVPHDFAQFMMFQEIFAGWLGIEVGSYFHLSDSLHVYEQDYNKLQDTSIIEEEQNTDSLALPKEQFEIVLNELVLKIKLLSHKNCSEKKLLDIIDWSGAPQAYLNLLLIVAAESARKRNLKSIPSMLIEQCTNSALSQLWMRWIERVGSNKSTGNTKKCLDAKEEIPSYLGL